ncbi:hypothetical protein BDN70DRAFT_919715 [Pholiota conissans]|uniref:Uncharacterized protein n=1 Tax=Pholiota conissans TaxID=109636 RepID=A0A9P6D314_9AGAR|nr:hypothetical protein BDN70DRAFT_919715 [Pholiota conissans]
MELVRPGPESLTSIEDIFSPDPPSSLVPHLPTELIDTVIDLANDFSNKNSRSRTLSALAGVSRLFRHRVNYHRFAKVLINRIDHITQVHNLLNNDFVWEVYDERIKARIQHFEVDLTYEEVHLKYSLNNDSTRLESVIQNVIQREGPGMMFTWDVQIQRFSGTQLLDWTFMSHSLQSALQNFLQESHFTAIRVYEESSSASIFSQMKVLNCCICDSDEYDMTLGLMRRTKDVHVLAIAFPEPVELPGPLIYDHFANLDTVRLTYYGALRPLSMEYSNLMKNAMNPFKPTVPTIRELRISLSLVSTNENKTDLQTVFSGHDFSPIDDYLSSSPHETLEVIDIHLNVAVSAWQYGSRDFFREEFRYGEGRDYARSVLFPKLARLGRPTLKIKMRSHYYSSTDYKWKYGVGIVA